MRQQPGPACGVACPSVYYSVCLCDRHTQGPASLCLCVCLCVPVCLPQACLIVFMCGGSQQRRAPTMHRGCTQRRTILPSLGCCDVLCLHLCALSHACSRSLYASTQPPCFYRGCCVSTSRGRCVSCPVCLYLIQTQATHLRLCLPEAPVSLCKGAAKVLCSSTGSRLPCAHQPRPSPAAEKMMSACVSDKTRDVSKASLTGSACVTRFIRASVCRCGVGVVCNCIAS